jgi:hypothetical protein
MPGASVYSLGVNWTAGYAAVGYNLYYPESQTELDLLGVHITVLRVTPEEIWFYYEK